MSCITKSFFSSLLLSTKIGKRNSYFFICFATFQKTRVFFWSRLYLPLDTQWAKNEKKNVQHMTNVSQRLNINANRPNIFWKWNISLVQFFSRILWAFILFFSRFLAHCAGVHIFKTKVSLSCDLDKSVTTPSIKSQHPLIWARWQGKVHLLSASIFGLCVTQSDKNLKIVLDFLKIFD